MRTFIIRVLFCFLGIWSIANAPSARAQQASTDSTDFAFLPAIAYNSDLGLILGGISSWYNYRDDVYPFYSYITLSGIFSTKGLASFSFAHDKPHAFGKDMRLITEMYVLRFFEDSFYGIGNYSTIKNTPPNLPDYYTFQSFSMGLAGTTRLPLKKISPTQQLDATFKVKLNYETPWGNGTDRLITTAQPLGVDGGRTFMLGTGLIWEGRNSEFNPTKGNFAKAAFSVGQKIWGSSYNLTVFEYDIRQYLTFHIIRDITLATRLSGTHTAGQVPYWEMAYAGDDETIRGYNARRFLDDNVAILNTELRTWLFAIPNSQTKFGGTLFFDVGSAFSNEDSFSGISDNLKYSAGFGGLTTLFTPEFIVRGDFGFSDEGMGVYFTIGFMF